MQDHDSARSGVGAGGDSESQRATAAAADAARNVIACSNCRSQKIKCFPSDDPDEPCKRCLRYTLQCEYLQHRRGRKKKEKKDEDEARPGSAVGTSQRSRPRMSLSGAASGSKRVEEDSTTSKAPGSSRTNVTSPRPGSSDRPGSSSKPTTFHLPAPPPPSLQPPVASTSTSISGPRMDQSGRPISNADYDGGFRREPLQPEPITYLQTRSILGPPHSLPPPPPPPPLHHPGGYQDSSAYTLPHPMDAGRRSMQAGPSSNGMPAGPAGYMNGGSSGMEQAGAGNGSGWMNVLSSSHGGYGNGPDMNQGNSAPMDYMNNSSRSYSSSTLGNVSSMVDPYRASNDTSSSLSHSGLPILPPPENMSFMNHIPPPPSLPVDTSGPNRIIRSSPHQSNFKNIMQNNPAPSLPFHPENSSRMTASSNGVALPPVMPTPSEGGSAASEARRARSPILPSLNSKFPFLNPNAGFRDAEPSHRQGAVYNPEKASPVVLRGSGDGSSDPSRQLPPLDQASGSGSNDRHSGREKFSLRHMVEPVDEVDLTGSDEERESDHEDQPKQSAAKQGYARDDVPPSKKRRLNDRGSEEPWGNPYEFHDPVSDGIITEDQARELFRTYFENINVSCPLLDKDLHTFEWVRVHSGFLFTAVICVTARFFRGGLETRSDVQLPFPPTQAKTIHHRCLSLARKHMASASQTAQATLDVIQATALLAIWKEADDDRASHHFNRAVMMAKELKLNRIESAPPDDFEEAKWQRQTQRIWLCLFVINTVFAMQFNSPLLITQDDHMVANSHDFFHASNDSATDVNLIASVQLRIKFLHYKSILDITASQPENHISARSNLISLSILTRTMNQDMQITTEQWIKHITDVTGAHTTKPYVWLDALLLNLNLSVSNQIDQIQSKMPMETRTGLQSSPAFHHCIALASDLLDRIKALKPRQLSFASDTLLHFTIYAGYFLYTVGAPSAAVPLERVERQHCYDILLGAADSLTSSAIFSADAPSLHARFLRRLVSSSQTLWEKEEAGDQVVPNPTVKSEVPLHFDHRPNNPDFQMPMVSDQNAYLPQNYPIPLDNNMGMAPPVATSGLLGDDTLLMQLWWDFMSNSGNMDNNGNLINNNPNGMQAY